VKKFLFIDLDDTLFQTRAKCSEADHLLPAATLRDGTANSFSTARQRALLEWMSHNATLIPTTARDIESFGRVNLSFNSYSILNFGGLVLKPGGGLDEHWQAQMAAEMAKKQAGLEEVIGLIDAYCRAHELPNRGRLISDAGIPFFALLKDPDKNLERLSLIEQAVLAPWLNTPGCDYVLHSNGNNLALMPKSLDKSRAVEYVSGLLRAEHGEIITLGMGDSRSDAAFMALCDYAIIPRASQLARAQAELLGAGLSSSRLSTGSRLLP
jgi:hydroxymethylpyrimidine pyrophosphatase-like HAD family hydrolase